MNRPHGLTARDTLEDALKRSDSLSNSHMFSGLLVSNKDLRRIVLLSWHLRLALALERKQNDKPAKEKTHIRRNAECCYKAL